MKPFNYITLTEAAKMSGKTTAALRNAIKREHLLAVKIGKTWLTDAEAVQTWMNDPEVHKTGKRRAK